MSSQTLSPQSFLLCFHLLHARRAERVQAIVAHPRAQRDIRLRMIQQRPSALLYDAVMCLLGTLRRAAGSTVVAAASRSSSKPASAKKEWLFEPMLCECSSTSRKLLGSGKSASHPSRKRAPPGLPNRLEERRPGQLAGRWHGCRPRAGPAGTTAPSAAAPRRCAPRAPCRSRPPSPACRSRARAAVGIVAARGDWRVAVVARHARGNRPAAATARGR